MNVFALFFVRGDPRCDISFGCGFFTGPWTVTRSSLRSGRQVVIFGGAFASIFSVSGVPLPLLVFSPFPSGLLRLCVCLCPFSPGWFALRGFCVSGVQ